MNISFLPKHPGRLVGKGNSSFPFARAFVFGAGGRGREAIETLRLGGVNIEAVIDNDVYKVGCYLDGIPISSPECLKGCNRPVVIASTYETDIFLQLRDILPDSEAIYYYRPNDYFSPQNSLAGHTANLEKAMAALGDEASRRMYRQLAGIYIDGFWGGIEQSDYAQYDHPEVCACPGDVILDIGGLDGDTAIFYMEKTHGMCKVFSFEPSQSNKRRFLHHTRRYKNAIELVEKGAWSHGETLRFNADCPGSPGSHRVDPDGMEVIEVIAIDSFVDQKQTPVHLIKMDIEGAELEALQGARETIARHHPKLQISIYHKPSHLWELQEFIESIGREYDYYIGHHSSMHTETILYARPRAVAGRHGDSLASGLPARP